MEGAVVVVSAGVERGKNGGWMGWDREGCGERK